MRTVAINTDFLIRCINKLEAAVEQLQQREPSDELYAVFREMSVKEFEIVLEQSGKLLIKAAASLLRQQSPGRPSSRSRTPSGTPPSTASYRWTPASAGSPIGTTATTPRTTTACSLRRPRSKLLPSFIDDARDLARIIAQDADD